MSSSLSGNNSTNVQRALILQGGGALGAYEAGVIKVLCDRLSREDDIRGKIGPVFDIVAGSSIGAVNGAILVGNVIRQTRESRKNRTTPNTSEIWRKAADNLLSFWNEIAFSTWWLENPIWDAWWNNLKTLKEQQVQYLDSLLANNKEMIESLIQKWPLLEYYFWYLRNWGPSASAEAARRYYSYQYFLSYGVPDVLYPTFTQPDLKFFNPLNPVWFRFDNLPLEKTVKRYWNYDDLPIKTTHGIKDNGVNEHGNEPRLLLVSVDIQDLTSAVTFDSYPKQEGLYKTEYGQGQNRRMIEYKEGINIKHVAASMSTHQKVKFSSFETIDPSNGKKEQRYFWDGAYLSNTPLREVIKNHRYYWKEVRNAEKVPNLEVYVINLYPSLDDRLPEDADSIQDREVDVKFHNRTKFDIKASIRTSDFVNLVNGMMEIVRSSKDERLEKEVKELLKRNAKSWGPNGKKRTYEEFLDVQFAIINTIYIERKNDKNTILGKAFDFSTRTIKRLIEDGHDEASTVLEIELVKGGLRKILHRAKNNDHDSINDLERILRSTIVAAYSHRATNKVLSGIDEFIAKLHSLHELPMDLVLATHRLTLRFLMDKVDNLIDDAQISESTGESMRQTLLQIDEHLLHEFGENKKEQINTLIVELMNKIDSTGSVGQDHPLGLAKGIVARLYECVMTHDHK